MKFQKLGVKNKQTRNPIVPACPLLKGKRDRKSKAKASKPSWLVEIVQKTKNATRYFLDEFLKENDMIHCFPKTYYSYLNQIKYSFWLGEQKGLSGWEQARKPRLQEGMRMPLETVWNKQEIIGGGWNYRMDTSNHCKTALRL